MSTTASSDARTVIVVNAITHRLELDSTVTLLDALREHLELLGSKKACDQGACSACTVLLDRAGRGTDRYRCGNPRVHERQSLRCGAYPNIVAAIREVATARSV